MMWGAEDLIATLGGSSSRRADGAYRDVARHVRSTILLAASAFGRLALDAVHLDILDVEGLQEEARDAAAVGFDVTVCIHPSQIPVVRKAYRPSHEKLAWARRVLPRREASVGVRVRRPDGRLSSAHARGNDVAASRGSHLRMRAQIPATRLRCVRDRSGLFTFGGIMEEAPVLRRAEALVRPAINFGSQRFPRRDVL